MRFDWLAGLLLGSALANGVAADSCTATVGHWKYDLYVATTRNAAGIRALCEGCDAGCIEICGHIRGTLCHDYNSAVVSLRYALCVIRMVQFRAAVVV